VGSPPAHALPPLPHPPPASGKSTVTSHLEQIDSRYHLYPRLKAGRGRVGEYRITTLDHIGNLREAREVVWSNERYGAVYVVDRPYLRRMVEEGRIPVLHVGQRAAVDAIVAALPDVQVTTVSLTCPRDLAVCRIAERATGDTADRIAAYDATEQFAGADLTIDTSVVSPVEAADLIANRVSK
jgi:guanylate kinase